VYAFPSSSRCKVRNIYTRAKLSRIVFVRVSVLFPLKVVTTKGGFHSFTLSLSRPRPALSRIYLSLRVCLTLRCELL
jgi:hypothetical protein